MQHHPAFVRSNVESIMAAAFQAVALTLTSNDGTGTTSCWKNTRAAGSMQMTVTWWSDGAPNQFNAYIDI